MADSAHPAGHVLQAFHDGELESALLAGVDAHCKECEVCQAELADLERVKQLLAASPTPALPRTVWHAVRPERRTEPSFKPAFGIAACAVGIVLGLLLGPVQFRGEETATEVASAESVDLWNEGATSSLLSVYQTIED